jgi:hypothetical protein
MPVDAKPLFRPDVLRPVLAAFRLPAPFEQMASPLRRWADTLSSPQAASLNEKELLPDFLTDVFCGVLGYTRIVDRPARFTFSREKYVQVDRKYADAVLGEFGPGSERFVVAVEGKGPTDPLEVGKRGRSSVRQYVLPSCVLVSRSFPDEPPTPAGYRAHRSGKSPENGTGTFIIPPFPSLLSTRRFGGRVPHPPSGLDSTGPHFFCQGPRPPFSFFPRPRRGTEPPGTPPPVSPHPGIRLVQEVRGPGRRRVQQVVVGAERERRQLVEQLLLTGVGLHWGSPL